MATRLAVLACVLAVWSIPVPDAAVVCVVPSENVTKPTKFPLKLLAYTLA